MRTKAICTNCGDPARLGGASVGERAHLGYCAGCYRTWRAAAREECRVKLGVPPDAGTGRNWFAGRPSHPSEDS